METVTPEERLKSIAACRSKVIRLRIQLTAAKEHVKQVNAELQKDIEHLLMEIDQPGLPFPDNP